MYESGTGKMGGSARDCRLEWSDVTDGWYDRRVGRELFTLETERIKLAQAAAPYLILRAALPLRMYIADHPLRGCMPQPESQRQELLLVLDELAKLKSEPASIPDAPGVKSKQRKHLHRLYPLLVKAIRVAGNDLRVFEALVNLTEMVGLEFGVLDE